MEKMLRQSLSFLFLSILILHISVEVSGTTMTLSNKCNHNVWPGIQPNAGNLVLEKGGFRLSPNKSYMLSLPAQWSGRMWGRYGCSFDATGFGKCITGDCGGRLFCNGTGGAPPATLAEITLGKNAMDLDFYDVSLVDGYNLAISLKPFKGGKGNCSYVGCVDDLNLNCPKELQVFSPRNKKRVVACKSACSAFNSSQYCCSGNYANPNTCKPTYYSKIFKTACPHAYSYAYDDKSSLSSCTGSNYTLTFCPPE